jgi:para-nitrobenzyl esterase
MTLAPWSPSFAPHFGGLMRALPLLPVALSLAFLVAPGCGSESSGTTTGTGGGSSSSTTTSTTTGTGGTGGGATGPTLITTDKGPVQGAALGSTLTFLGIPFAAPPVGALRWKPPQPAAAWTEARDATKKGPFCPQLNALSPSPMPGTSEDCLTLNVWTPSTAAGAKAPVLFWVHGGGFILGSGAEATYDGQALSEATGSVVVTINYRLGPLGFLAHAALASEDAAYPSAGMYGFEDQRAALVWAKNNIQAFGGDPDNLTLFGESAGGISTCLHLISPLSKGLFHRAIIESGPCETGTGILEKDAEAQGDDLAKAVGCGDPATALACLRGKAADELLVALPGKKGLISGDGVSWFPMVDGLNIPDQPSTLLAAGKIAKVPVILGSNKNEGTLFFTIGASAKDDAEYEALMSSIFANQGAKIVAQYPSAKYGSAKDAAAEAFGDGAFVCPTRTDGARPGQGRCADLSLPLRPRAQGPLPEPGRLPLRRAALHLRQPPPGDHARGGRGTGPLQGDDRILVEAHSLTGDPNSKGALAWPSFELGSDTHLVLDLTLSTAERAEEAPPVISGTGSCREQTRRACVGGGPSNPRLRHGCAW